MKHLSAVHLALVSASEAIAVWTLNVLLFYASGGRCKSRYGEDWKGLLVWIQLLGFVCVASGAFVYYGAARGGCAARAKGSRARGARHAHRGHARAARRRVRHRA